MECLISGASLWQQILKWLIIKKEKKTNEHTIFLTGEMCWFYSD